MLKKTLLNKDWWTASLIRMIKTVAQSAVAAIGTTSITIGEINWMMVGSTALLAGILSLLTSLAGLPEISGTSSGNENEV